VSLRCNMNALEIRFLLEILLHVINSITTEGTLVANVPICSKWKIKISLVWTPFCRMVIR